jgi:hypothetical protein
MFTHLGTRRISALGSVLSAHRHGKDVRVALRMLEAPSFARAAPVGPAIRDIFMGSLLSRRPDGPLMPPSLPVRSRLDHMAAVLHRGALGAQRKERPAETFSLWQLGGTASAAREFVALNAMGSFRLAPMLMQVRRRLRRSHSERARCAAEPRRGLRAADGRGVPAGAVVAGLRAL